MHNEVFYATAATVIPLLLISVIATRSMRAGELHQQATSTILIFGVPVIGETAALAFLFFEPMPTAAAVILSALTWAGLLSQLGLAAWWLTDLTRSDRLAAISARRRLRICPMCAAQHAGPGEYCRNCHHVPSRQNGDGDAAKTHISSGVENWLLDILACPECKAPVEMDKDANELVCISATCGLAYPIRDNIPVLLVEESRRPSRERATSVPELAENHGHEGSATGTANDFQPEQTQVGSDPETSF